MLILTKFKTFLDNLCTLKGTNAKIDYVRQNSDDDIKCYLKYVYDPYITFGVNKVPQTNTIVPVTFLTNLNKEFIDILESLRHRNLTGNSALEKIEKFKEKCNGYDLGNVVDKVIKKDLRCGLAAKSINKAIPKLIPEFEIMTCGRIDEKHAIPEKGYAQAKLDGVRNVSIVDFQKNIVVHYSRSGKEVVAFSGIFDEELIKLAKKLYMNYVNMNSCGIFVFDGEVCGATWNETMNAKASVNENIEAKDKLKYYIFDWMPFENWQNKLCNMDQGYIYKSLHKTLNEEYTKLIYPETVYYDSFVCAQQFFRHCIAVGYEGAIMKAEKSTYQFKRSDDWMKWKPVQDYDGEIVEIIEGTGKIANMMGAIFISGVTENGYPFLTKVGTGFTEENRKYFWENRESLIGKVVEIECQDITDPDENETYSLRFPVFKRFRDDK